MLDEHSAAVMALLAAEPLLTPYDGVVPPGADPRTMPYVLAYFYGSYPELSFDGTVYDFQLRIVLHCVTGSPKAARMVSDLAAGRLLDVTPTVAGRSCYPIRFEDSTPPQRDESISALVMDQVDTYLLKSVPA